MTLVAADLLAEATALVPTLRRLKRSEVAA